MFEVIKSDRFDRWLKALRDHKAIARINARIRRTSLGNLGDVSPVGDGVYEMRIFHGPGYRLYFIQEGTSLIVLLSGGDKSSQQRDITVAKRLAGEWRNRQ